MFTTAGKRLVGICFDLRRIRASGTLNQQSRIKVFENFRIGAAIITAVYGGSAAWLCGKACLSVAGFTFSGYACEAQPRRKVEIQTAGKPEVFRIA